MILPQNSISLISKYEQDFSSLDCKIISCQDLRAVTLGEELKPFSEEDAKSMFIDDGEHNDDTKILFNYHNSDELNVLKNYDISRRESIA